MDQPVLVTLPETDWSSVEHAYGSATDVPDLLRALASPDSEDRGKAMWELYGNVIHQNIRYSATPKVIPHLIELIATDGVPDKATLLRYLVNLIAGPYTVRDGFWICDGERNLWQGDEDQAAISLACYQAALPGVPALLELASGPLAAIRTASICALGCFRTERATIAPRLRERATVERAASVRAAIVFALALLTEGNPEFEVTLRPFHEGDSSALVRLTAAIMLALHGFGDGGVVQTLIDGMGAIELRYKYEQLPWGHERLLGDVGHALAAVSPELGVRAVAAIGKALLVADQTIETDRMSLVQVIGLVSAVNALAFPYGGGLVTPAQREAVTALVRAKSPWIVGNVTPMLKEMGLPNDRAANAALVGIDIDGPDEPAVDDLVDVAAAQVSNGEAELAYLTLAELPDDHPYVLFNRGRALMDLDRAAEGIETLELTVERFPDLAIGWNVLACGYYRLGRHADALGAVDNAIRFNSDEADYYYNRMLFRRLTGDVEGAFADAREMVDRDPALLPELETESEIADLLQDPRWAEIRQVGR